MKKIILITTLVAFAGCATSDEFENLLFEEDALLLAKLERPVKFDINPEDDQYPAETLGKRDACAERYVSYAHKWVKISRIINTSSGPKTVSYYQCGKCGVRQPWCGTGFNWRCRVR